MKKILNHVPGFRSRTPKKMIIGGLYYLFCLMFFTVGILPTIAMLSIPFAIFSLIDAIRYKKPLLLLLTGGLCAVFVACVSLSPSVDTDSVLSPTPNPTVSALPASSPEPTAQPTETPTSTPFLTEPPIEDITPIPTEPVNYQVNEETESYQFNEESEGYQTTQESPVSNTERTVYIGNTGTKYHRESCSTLKGKGHAISLDSAIDQGREPCKRCKP